MKKHLSILTAVTTALVITLSLQADTALADGTAATTTPITGTPQWTVISEDATATIYHATPAQCNADCLHTASMYQVVPDKVASQRILAMERTMMARCGIAYGDIVKVTGAGDLDGLWRVEDTMNRRYAGQDKIDFLVPATRKAGFWKGVTVAKPADAVTERWARSLLAAM